MDFALSDELLGLRETVRKLAQDKIKPRAREIDVTGAYPQDIFDEFKKADLFYLLERRRLQMSLTGVY